jgi:hypothetical protein
MTGRTKRRETMTLHQIVEGDPKAYGSVDLWSFDLVEVGRPLPCGNVRTFLHYLCSGGTRVVSIGTYSDPSGAVKVVLWGPRAEDGQFLSVPYLLRREEIHGDGTLYQGLEGSEKRLLVERIDDINPSGHKRRWLAVKALVGVLDLPYAA